MTEESAITFACRGETLLGVLHQAHGDGDVLCVMVVGGPQYRVGSHRMFVRLARSLAESGVAVFRFDCRGMGDSDGAFETFERLAPDIEAAVETALAQSGRRRVALFGLCDGASAALMYAQRDPRVAGLLLLNPWVTTESTQARTRIRHYYVKRLAQGEFWRGLWGRRRTLAAALNGLIRTAGAGLADPGEEGAYVDRMRRAAETFQGPVSILLSGKDLTAREFADLIASDSAWAAAMQRDNFTVVALGDADHTISGPGSFETFLKRCRAFFAALAPPGEARTTPPVTNH